MEKNILTLNLKKEYFEQIKAGSKVEEFRECRDYWEKRLSKEFDEIHIKLGYPKRGDTSRVLKFLWNGYKVKKIIHPHFGDKKIKVYAIDLSKRK